MEITKLQPTKRGRISIFADEQFCFSADAETLTKFGLYQGMQITVEQLEELRLAVEQQSAKAKAFTLLSYTSHSKKQLYSKLRRTCDEPAAQAAVARMEDLGLINDQDYAVRAAKDLLHLKGWGKARVRQELQHRGISADHIAIALDEATQDYDAPARIQALVERKYARYLGDAKGIAKIMAALQRLGYEYSDIKAALYHLNSTCPDED